MRSHGIVFDSDPTIVASALEDPQKYQGFLFNLKQHWFVVRKLRTSTGLRWFNLNSLQKAPMPLGDFFVSAFLSQMKTEGFSIFVVLPGPCGHLPDPVDTAQGDPGCWIRMSDVISRGHTAADARRSAADRARQTAQTDPEFEAALAASLGDAVDGDSFESKRVRLSEGAWDRSTGGEDSDLQEALRLSLFASGDEPHASHRTSDGLQSSGETSSDSDDAAALAAAVALSLGGVSNEIGGCCGPALSEDAVASEMRYLRRSLGLEPPPASLGAPGGSIARLQIKVPGIAPVKLPQHAFSAAPNRPQQRRFAVDAPLAAVFNWAALVWLDTAFPHLVPMSTDSAVTCAPLVESVAADARSSASSADAGDSMRAPAPPLFAFTLTAALRPPINVRSDCVADREATVGSSGLMPSATLVLQPC